MSGTPGDRRARAAIDRAGRTGRPELDLSGLGLTTPPEEVGRLTGLRRLSLSRNQLTAIPAWTGRLTGLRSLDLSGNRLSELPAELGRLTQLRTLTLAANLLTGLPAGLGRLTRLQRLDLEVNPLAEPLAGLAAKGYEAVLACLERLRKAAGDRPAGPRPAAAADRRGRHRQDGGGSNSAGVRDQRSPQASSRRKLNKLAVAG
jgi:hypothetical protein